MNKIEILKLAFEKSESAQEAMLLARQMVAFISDAPVVFDQQKLILQQPKQKFCRKMWSNAEIETLRDLMEQGRTIAEISIIMKRSAPSIDKAVYKLGSGRQLGKQKAA